MAADSVISPFQGTAYIPNLFGPTGNFTPAAGGGGGESGLQSVSYTVAPPANPPNVTADAVAFDPTGNLPTLWWNKTLYTWN